MNDKEVAIVLTGGEGENSKVINATVGKCLLEVLVDQKIYVNAPCGGRGTCGKCKVEIKSGRLLLALFNAESKEYAMAGETALACQSFLVEDCAVDIRHLGEKDFMGVDDFDASAAEPLGTELEIVRFVPAPGCWNDGRSVTDVINKSLARSLRYSPKALRQLSIWMGNSLQQNFTGPGPELPIYLTIRADSIIQIRTEEATPVYGIGIDIGTTTIAFALVDLITGLVKKTVSVLNSQRRYGADVISRIQKGSEGMLIELQNCIRADISREIIKLTGAETDEVVRLVIAGNTTMLHLLLGLRSDSLALFPFSPITTSAMEFSAAKLFGAAVECEVTLLPSVGAYMGADIVAGMLYCRIRQDEGPTLLLDVGTNGEMAIRGKDRIICASTAAGPAFEGANISWGIGSVPGAIARVDIKGRKIHFDTIGDAPPIGICGSAVVDIVAVCLRNELIDRTGRFVSTEKGQEELRITKNLSGDWICFTQKDVREFQLAKSAIRSGLEILIREFGCRWEEIKQVYLAGGFGARIDVENAIEVGLFPEALRGKIRSVGNSTLGGTVHYLLYKESRQAVDELVNLAAVIDLSKHSNFNDLFMEQLQF